MRRFRSAEPNLESGREFKHWEVAGLDKFANEVKPAAVLVLARSHRRQMICLRLLRRVDSQIDQQRNEARREYPGEWARPWIGSAVAGRFRLQLAEFLAAVRGRLIVSCQAPDGDPFRDPESMARFARAAELGGAAAIRANGAADVRSIRAATPVTSGVEKDVPDQ